MLSSFSVLCVDNLRNSMILCHGVNVDAVVFGLFSRCELCCLTLRAYCTSIDTTKCHSTHNDMH